MSQYKVTTMWNQSVMGVSESWYTPDVNLSQLRLLLQSYHAARFNCMFDNQFMVGVRVSLYGAKRQSIVLLPPFDILPGTGATVNLPTQGSFPAKSQETNPDQLRAVIQTRIGYSDTRTAIRYLSGVSDQVTKTEPATIAIGSDPAWWQAFSKYTFAVTNLGLNIRAKAVTGPNAPATVTGVTSQSAAPSLLGIILPAATAPPFTQGAQIALQHFRPAKFTRSATVNGTWTVDSTNTTLVPGSIIVYLRNSGTIDPATVRITALSTIQLIGYQLYPVQSMTWIRAGIHKRGRPSMSPRGRRLSRPTLDP